MRKRYMVAAILAMLITVGCSDTTNEAIATLTRDGFIKGDVVTQRADGRAWEFSYDFSMQDYPTEYESPFGSQIVWVERIPDFQADWNGDSYAEIGLYIDSLNQDTARFYQGYLEHLVPTGDSVVYYRMYNYTTNGRILNFKYDASTQTISGDYIYTGTNYNGWPAIVTGSFQSKLRFTFYKPTSNNNR